jgi:hypothetical protein
MAWKAWKGQSLYSGCGNSPGQPREDARADWLFGELVAHFNIFINLVIYHIWDIFGNFTVI